VKLPCPRRRGQYGCRGIAPVIHYLGPAALTPGMSTGIHFTESWVGPRSDFEGFGELKISPTRIRSPDRPAISIHRTNHRLCRTSISKYKPSGCVGGGCSDDGRHSSGVPRNFVRGGGGVQQIRLRAEDRQNGISGGGSPLVRDSEVSCNLVQEISFHIVKFS